MRKNVFILKDKFMHLKDKALELLNSGFIDNEIYNCIINDIDIEIYNCGVWDYIKKNEIGYCYIKLAGTNRRFRVKSI